MKTFRLTAAAVAVAAILISTSAASAGTTTCRLDSDPSSSRRGVGSFGGTATYDDASGLLTFVLDNTSSARLTGLAFKLTDGAEGAYVDGDDAQTRRDDDAFDDARRGRNGAVKAKRFGTFDAGAALDGKWGRGKGAKRGLDAGESQTFIFRVNGGKGLTAADLLGGDASVVASFKSRQKDGVAGSVSLLPGEQSGNLPGRDLDPSEANNGNNSGGGSGGGNSPVAIPLPPAVWTGMATLGVLALPAVRRRLRLA